MTNGLNLLNRLVNANTRTTLFKKHIWPFLNIRHRKKSFIMGKCLKDICTSHLKRLLINFIMQKIKFTKFQLTKMKTLFNWSQKITLKNMKHFTRFAPLLIKKWNLGHGTIENLQNYIVTLICQFVKLQRLQI